MKVGGHRLREHIKLLLPLFGFITLVWALRILLDELASVHSLVRVLSVTGASSVAILFAVVLIYVRGFGSYPNVVIASLLLVGWGQGLIIAAIVFSVLTGTENIFTAPEFSIPHDDPHHVRHIIGHLTFGIGGGVLIGSAFGCLILWMLKKVLPEPRPT
jgi:hypothetical protein